MHKGYCADEKQDFDKKTYILLYISFILLTRKRKNISQGYSLIKRLERCKKIS